MRAAIYCDDKSLTSLCKKLVRDQDILVSLELDEGEVARSDLLVVGFFFLPTSDPLDLVNNHLYNDVVVMTSQGPLPGGAVSVSTLEEMSEKLSLLKSERPRAEEIYSTKKSRRKRLVKSYNKKVECIHCGELIGDVELGLKAHYKSCYEYKNRKHAYGYLSTLRQPSGRTKGSILEFYVPDKLTIDGVEFQPGLHVVCRGRLIKAINAELKNIYHYDLVVDDPKEES